LNQVYRWYSKIFIVESINQSTKFNFFFILGSATMGVNTPELTLYSEERMENRREVEKTERERQITIIKLVKFKYISSII